MERWTAAQQGEPLFLEECMQHGVEGKHGTWAGYNASEVTPWTAYLVCH